MGPAVRAHRRHREWSVPGCGSEDVRRPADAEARRQVRGSRCHHRHRHVAGRAAAHGRSDHADGRGGEAGDRGRRTEARGHRRLVDVSRARYRGRHVGRGHHRVRRGDATAAVLDQQRDRDARPSRIRDRGDARGRRWSVQPRALLPHGLGVDVRAAAAGRARPLDERRHGGGDRCATDRWRHAVASAVRRVVGRQLDRHARVGPLRQVRHNARDPRMDRVECTQERRAHAVGDLQGTAHDGRLHERAHDHDAVRTVRLRRAVRRRGRGHRVAQGPRRRPEAEARVPRCRGHPDQRADQLGSGHPRPRAARDRARAPPLDPHRPRAVRRRHGHALRRLLVQLPVVDRGARVLRRRRGQGLPRGRQEHRPRRHPAAEHPRRPALVRPPARLRIRPRGSRPAARRRGRAPARARGDRGRVSNGGGAPGGCFLFTAR